MPMYWQEILDAIAAMAWRFFHFDAGSFPLRMQQRQHSCGSSGTGGVQLRLGDKRLHCTDADRAEHSDK
jgi:hypothetical protein